MKVGHQNTFNRIHDGINGFWEFKKKELNSHTEKFKMFVYDVIPTFSATLADNFMVITHYLPNEANKDCPAFGLINFKFFKKPESLYHVYNKNLIAMIDNALEIKDDNIKVLLDAAKTKANTTK